VRDPHYPATSVPGIVAYPAGTPPQCADTLFGGHWVDTIIMERMLEDREIGLQRKT
jgi:hypothetical protein